MFETKRFKIKFQKACIPDWPYISSWYEVTDGKIVSILETIKEEYKFDVLSIRLKPAFHNSCITIRCNRSDCTGIFMKFCKLAGKYIDYPTM